MTRRATPKTLLNRKLKDSDFPFTIVRKRWIEWFTLLVIPFCLGLAACGIWLLTQSAFRENWGALFFGIFAFLLLVAAYTGVDNMGFRLVVDAEGISAIGRLKTRRMSWEEITHFGTWRGRAVTGDGVFPLGFYQLVIYVDGSNNPKRMLRNLFFAGHFVPPIMELGGKELVRLLNKARKHLGKDVGGLN